MHVDVHGADALTEPWTQLWLGGALAFTLRSLDGTLGYRPTHHRGRQRSAAERPAPPPVSPHLIDPAQEMLFEARRDWSCITIGSLGRLPSLTPSAQHLLEAFRRHGRERAWDSQVIRLATRSMRIVLAWVGADAPIPEADIRALSAVRPGTTARRSCSSLPRSTCSSLILLAAAAGPTLRPALVMWPRCVWPPLECSEATRPTKPMKEDALAKRRQSQTSLTRVSAPMVLTPR